MDVAKTEQQTNHTFSFLVHTAVRPQDSRAWKWVSTVHVSKYSTGHP
jgi:hypothetical protein